MVTPEGTFLEVQELREPQSIELAYRGCSPKREAGNGASDQETDSKAQRSLRTLARFLEMSRERSGESAEVLLHRLLSAVDAVRGDAAVADDITAMAVRYQ